LLSSKDFQLRGNPAPQAGLAFDEQTLCRLALVEAKRALEDKFDIDPRNLQLEEATLADVAFLVADGFELNLHHIGQWTNNEELHQAIGALRGIGRVERRNHT